MARSGPGGTGPGPDDIAIQLRFEFNDASINQAVSKAEEVGKKVNDALEGKGSSSGNGLEKRLDQIEAGLKDVATQAQQTSQTVQQQLSAASNAAQQLANSTKQAEKELEDLELALKGASPKAFKEQFEALDKAGKLTLPTLQKMTEQLTASMTHLGGVTGQDAERMAFFADALQLADEATARLLRSTEALALSRRNALETRLKLGVPDQAALLREVEAFQRFETSVRAMSGGKPDLQTQEYLSNMKQSLITYGQQQFNGFNPFGTIAKDALQAQASVDKAQNSVRAMTAALERLDSLIKTRQGQGWNTQQLLPLTQIRGALNQSIVDNTPDRTTKVISNTMTELNRQMDLGAAKAEHFQQAFQRLNNEALRLQRTGRGTAPIDAANDAVKELMKEAGVQLPTLFDNQMASLNQHFDNIVNKAKVSTKALDNLEERVQATKAQHVGTASTQEMAQLDVLSQKIAQKKAEVAGVGVATQKAMDIGTLSWERYNKAAHDGVLTLSEVEKQIRMVDSSIARINAGRGDQAAKQRLEQLAATLRQEQELLRGNPEEAAQRAVNASMSREGMLEGATTRAKVLRGEITRCQAELLKLQKQFSTADPNAFAPLQNRIKAMNTELSSMTTKGGLSAIVGKVGQFAGWALIWTALYGTIRSVENVMKDIVGETMEFDKAMRHVNTVAKLNEADLSKVRDIVLDLSGTPLFGGMKPSAIAGGLYFIESAGIKDSAKALETLAASGQLAIGTQSKLEDSAQAIVSLMSIYGDRMRSASEAADNLFAVIDVAVPEMNEFNKAQADLMVTAAVVPEQAFSKIGAAWAALTREGFNAQRAATGIKNAMMDLVNPGKELEQTIWGLGYASGVAMVKELGLVESLQKIYVAVGKDDAAFVKVLGSIRAAGAALVLVADGAKVYHDALSGVNADLEKQVGNYGSAGAAARAYAEQMKSLNFGAAELAAALRANIMSELSPIYQMLVWISQQMGKAGRTISSWTLARDVQSAIESKPGIVNKKLGESGVTVGELAKALGQTEAWDVRAAIEYAVKEANGKTTAKGIANAATMIKNYKSGSAPMVGSQFMMDLYTLTEGSTKAAQDKLAKMTGQNLDFLAASGVEGIIPAASQPGLAKVSDASASGSLYGARKAINEAIRVASGKQSAGAISSEAAAQEVLSVIDQYVTQMVTMGIKEGQAYDFIDPVTSKKSKVKPLDEIMALYREWYPKTKSAQSKAGQAVSATGAFDTWLDTLRNNAEKGYDALDGINQTLAEQIGDSGSNLWKKYQDDIKGVELTNKQLINSFDEAGKGIQKAFYDYFSIIESEGVTNRAITDFTTLSNKLAKDRERIVAEAGFLYEDIEAQRNSLAGHPETFTDPTKEKAYVLQHDGAFDAIEKDANRLAELDSELKKVTAQEADAQNRLRDLANQMLELDNKKADFMAFLGDLNQQVLKYTQSSGELAADSLRTQNDIMMVMMDAALQKGVIPDLETYYKWLDQWNIIMNGKTAEHSIQQGDIQMGILQSQAARNTMPTARELVNGRSLSDVWQSNMSTELLLKAKNKNLTKLGPDKLADREAVETALSQLYNDNVQKAVALIQAVSETNMPKASEMLKMLTEYVGKLDDSGKLAKQTLDEFAATLEGPVAKAAERVAQADRAMLRDQDAIIEKISALQALRAAQVKDGNITGANATDDALFQEVSTYVQRSLQIFQGQASISLDKSATVGSLLESLLSYEDIIAQSPDLQNALAQGLVSVFGSKDLAESILAGLADDNPMYAVLVGLIENAFENPELIDDVQKAISEFRNSVEQGFSDMFMSIISEGKTFEDAWKSLMRSLAIDVERQLINKLSEMLFGNLWSWIAMILGFGGSGYKGGTPVSAVSAMAQGGIFSGSFMPFQAFSQGGIAGRPTLGLVGEGGRNEAIVPLPNGRSIPVQMMGAARQAQDINSTTVLVFDKQQLAAMRTSPGEVVNTILVDLNTNGPIRQTMRRRL